MKRFLHQRRMSGQRPGIIIVLLLALLNALAIPVMATSAAPDAENIFTVEAHVADNNNADTLLTLREALLLARGGTGPKGLNRHLSAAEAKSVKGCTLGQLADGSVAILADCGEGFTDTIRLKTYSFYPHGARFDIYSSLPPIDDTAPTIIVGEPSTIRPILDFSFNNDTQGLQVKSSNNVIQGIDVTGNHCAQNVFCTGLVGITVAGNNNQLLDVAVYQVAGYGIQVTGKGNLIDNARVGVLGDNMVACQQFGLLRTGVMRDGIDIADGAQNSTVKNSLIGCNGAGGWDGIAVGAATQGTVIGPNNRIGTNGKAGIALLGNGNAGIALFGATQVTVISNTIAYNGKSGIVAYNSSNNVIAGNLLRSNKEDGIALLGAANNNAIGGPTAGSPYGGNRIGLNQQHGIYIGPEAGAPGDTPTGNRLAGNWIGTLDVVKAAANQGSGILVDGAAANDIGDPAGAPNIIGGNGSNGIGLTNGAHDNILAHNYIGTNSFTFLGNSGSGLVIDHGAHHNLVGGSEEKAANLIAANSFPGVVLNGANTTANSFTLNRIFRNQGGGVLITGGAHHNSFGGTGLFGGLVNQVYSNEGPGVQIEQGAHHNLVGGNSIADNLGPGIRFADAATEHNHVELAKLSANRSVDGDGIAQGEGAANNDWSKISTYENGGLGIDLNAVALNNQTDSPYPTITTIGVTTDTVIVTGNALPSNANETVTVEVYRSANDPSGFGEGQTYIGSTQVAADGFFAVGTKGKGGCFTAFLTSSTNSGSSSSEFSPVVCKGTLQSITLAAIDAKFVKDPSFAINPTASSGLPVTVEAEGQCTVTQQKVTLTGEGLCTLIARQEGNDSFAPAPDKVVQFAITKKPQTITWGLSAAGQHNVVNDAPFALNATASSGLPVSFGAQGVCTVNSNQVTLTGAPGICTLTAQQAGNDEYYPATGDTEATLEVSKVAQSITFGPLAAKQISDPAFMVSATASSNLPVSFLAEGVCSVSEATVTLSGQSGLCTITAIQSGDAIYNSAPDVAHTFTVNDLTKQSQTINFGPLPDKGIGDAPFAPTASASSGLPVSFNSLTPAVCTVDNGQVTLMAVGLCTLRADQPGDATFNPATSVAQSFFVSDPAKQQQTITFADISVKTLGDGPVALVAAASSGLPVTITSQTPTVCSVAGAQTTLLAGGVCTLVASQVGDGNFNPALPVVRTFLVRSGQNALYLPLISR